MSNRNLLFIILMLMALLTGCQNKQTYHYLMTHPEDLQKAMSRCATDKSSTAQTHCDVVEKAAADFTTLVNDMQSNPERFGERILAEETTLGQMKLALQQAKVALNTANTQLQDAAQLASAEDHFKTAEQAYQQQKQTVKTLLAVAGLGRPS